MYDKILIATDGSEYAHRAAKHAIWVANASNADLIILHVVELHKLPKIDVQEDEVKIKDILFEEGNAIFEDLSELLDESTGDIEVSYMIKEGSPANVILQTIEENDVDLVVMGTSGKTDFDIILIGSVAEKVLRNAECAVTIIH